MRAALVTCRKHPSLAEDDRPLLGLLAREGIDASPVSWDDPDAAWEKLDLILVRSTWDYVLRPKAFEAWLGTLASLPGKVLNPPALMRWNLRKTYLRELEERGVPIVPTEWLEAGNPDLLEALLRERGWGDAVAKPSVSADALRTIRFSAGDLRRHRHLLGKLAADPPFLLQPFLPSIQTEGELSFLYFAGSFSHAVLKLPAEGDFRVQTRHGGRLRKYEPSRGELAQADAVLAALPFSEAPLYARVDVLRRESGGPLLLSELELIEPSLYLAEAPGATERFCAAICSKLSK
jgi:hypothetical protein